MVFNSNSVPVYALLKKDTDDFLPTNYFLLQKNEVNVVTMRISCADVVEFYSDWKSLKTFFRDEWINSQGLPMT